MGKVCSQCGREVSRRVVEAEGSVPRMFWECPHCGPNVLVQDAKPEVQESDPVVTEERCLLALLGVQEARIEDLQARVQAQDGLIQHLLGHPEKVPTRDDLIEALATARGRLEAEDRGVLALRDHAAELQAQIEFLATENRTLSGVLKKLVEKMPDDAFRAVSCAERTMDAPGDSP